MKDYDSIWRTQDELIIKHKKGNRLGFLLRYFAEREGFEPPVPLGTVVFKTTVIDHSTISPVLYLSRKRVQRYEFSIEH